MHFELVALRFAGHLPALQCCTSAAKSPPPAPRAPFGFLQGGLLCPACRQRATQVAMVSAAALRCLSQLADPGRQSWQRLEIDARTYGELRGLMNQYLLHLLGRRPRMHDYL